MGAYYGGVKHLNQMRGLAHRRERIEEGFECTGPAQSPEPLPHAVPMPELGRKRTPSNVVAALPVVSRIARAQTYVRIA